MTGDTPSKNNVKYSEIDSRVTPTKAIAIGSREVHSYLTQSRVNPTRGGQYNSQTEGIESGAQKRLDGRELSVEVGAKYWRNNG